MKKKIIPSLNLSNYAKPINRQVFLLPNHDLLWMENLIKVINENNCKKILVVGYLYGSIIDELLTNKNITIVDNDSLAILSQSFAIWLNRLLRENKDKLMLLMFLDYYNVNIKYSKFRNYLRPERYKETLILFNEFVNMYFKNEKLNCQSIKNLYEMIFNIGSYRGVFYINLKRKGFNYSILQNTFSKPLFNNRVIVRNITDIKEKFDFIITTNVIDFYDDNTKFLNKAFNLLNRNGFIELHSYKKDTQDFIKNKYYLSKSNKYAYAFLFKENINNFQYIRKKIFLNDTFFVLQK